MRERERANEIQLYLDKHQRNQFMASVETMVECMEKRTFSAEIPPDAATKKKDRFKIVVIVVLYYCVNTHTHDPHSDSEIKTDVRMQ